MKSLIALVFLAALPQNLKAQTAKLDHPVAGSTVTLTGEIVSLRCFLLDPVKGRGPEHSKCAEASIRRGEAAGFLADGNLYVLLGVADPKIRPVLLASVREEITITGVLSRESGIMGLSIKDLEARGRAVKPAPLPTRD